MFEQLNKAIESFYIEFSMKDIEKEAFFKCLNLIKEKYKNDKLKKNC